MLESRPQDVREGWLEVYNLENRKQHLLGCMMPGQCGIFVVNDFGSQSREILTPLLEEVERIAEEWGYAYLMASTVPWQKGAISALKLSGWEDQWNFNNPRTHNRVTMWYKELVNARKGIHWSPDGAFDRVDGADAA